MNGLQGLSTIQPQGRIEDIGGGLSPVGKRGLRGLYNYIVDPWKELSEVNQLISKQRIAGQEVSPELQQRMTELTLELMPMSGSIKGYKGPGYNKKIITDKKVIRNIADRYRSNGLNTFDDIQKYYGPKNKKIVDFEFIDRPWGTSVYQKHAKGVKHLGVANYDPSIGKETFKIKYSDIRNRGASHDEAIAIATEF